MNVLFWCGDYFPDGGGAAAVTGDLASALLRGGHQVTVITRAKPGLPEEETRDGCRIVRLRFPVAYEKLEWSPSLIWRSPDIVRRVWRLLSAADTVCIGLLDLSALYVLLLRPLLRFRLVLYLHGGDTRKLPEGESSYRKMFKAALRAADAVIPVSPELAREAAAYLPAAGAKMHIIANGIDVEFLRSAQPWRHPREYIAFVGRLVPEKGVPTLIEAFHSAAARIPHVDLLICGTGDQGGEVEWQARSGSAAGRIHFTGRLTRQEAQSVIKGALFLVLPSHSEGDPIVAIEALVAGKPVIGSDIPAISRLITSGVNGALFPQRDAGALAALLETYCNDRAALAELTAAAGRTDCSAVSMRLLLPRHLTIYQEPNSHGRFYCDPTAEAE